MKVLCAHVILVIAFVAIHAEDVPVETNVGTFVGFADEKYEDGTTFRVSKFLGIPYAKSPVGNLRFRKPVAKAPLTKPLQAKVLGNVCMQVLPIPKRQNRSEDCLFLNVYSPLRTTSSDANFPVMIWIHGGGFTQGSANAYAPDRLVANGPVIVVTINYRLSIWGFLSTEDSNSLGNYGLWDQHLAIKWVHDNIDKFGGDPNRITIFGESAGSASVIYQGWYPGNKGLFQRIIGQSGSPFAGWASARAPLSAAKEFAALTGCDTENNLRMVECLRQLDNNVINSTLNNLSNGFAIRFSTFVPFPDNEFVTEFSTGIGHKYSSRRSVFSNFDLLTGTTSGEGYIFTPPSIFEFQTNRTFFKNTLVPQFASGLDCDSSDVLKHLIIAEYTDWNDPENSETIREQFCDILTDVSFLTPMMRVIHEHTELASRPSSYLYYLTVKPSNHALPTPTWASKPNHADDLIYVFDGGADLSEFGKPKVPDLEAWERVYAKDMMTLWTNFAKTGNPNKPRNLGVDWLPFTKKHGHYLDMSPKMNAKGVKTRLRDQKVNFWTNIVPAVMNKCKRQAACEKDGECNP